MEPSACMIHTCLKSNLAIPQSISMIVPLFSDDVDSSEVKLGLDDVENSDVKLGLVEVVELDTSVDVVVEDEQRLRGSPTARACSCEFRRLARFQRQQMTSEAASRNLCPLTKYIKKLMELLAYVRKVIMA